MVAPASNNSIVEFSDPLSYQAHTRFSSGSQIVFRALLSYRLGR